MPTSRLRTAGLIPAAALFGCALLFLLPLLFYPFARDHGVYAVVAEAMARGGMPYADAWDLKTPGIFLVFRTALGLFGRNMWGVRVLELLFLAGTAVALFRLGRRLDPVGSGSGLLGAAWFLLFLGHNLNFWHTAQAESFLMLPLVLGLELGLRALGEVRPPRALAWSALSGLCTGLVFVLKFPNILPIACLLPLLFLPPGGKAVESPPPGRPGRWPLIACFAAGSLLVPLITSAWFALGGAFGHMTEALFIFAPRYAGITVSGALVVHGLKVFSGFFLPGQGLLLPKLLCLAGVAVCLVRWKGASRFVLPLWLVLSLLVIWIQGKFFLYHYLPLYLPCALLAGVAGAAAARGIAARVRGDEQAKRRAGATFFTLLLLLPFLLDAGTLRRHWQDALAGFPVNADGAELDQYRDGSDFSLAADLEVAEHLRQLTVPGETVFIWGFEPLVYFLADRQPASRFITHQPLASRWQMPGWRDQLLSDLAAAPPARILVLRNDAMPAVTGSDLDSAGLLREFPGLDSFISRYYGLETEIEDFLVYRPLNAGGSRDDQH